MKKPNKPKKRNSKRLGVIDIDALGVAFIKEYLKIKEGN